MPTAHSDRRRSRRSAAPKGFEAARDPAERAFHELLCTMGRIRQVMEPYFARFGISGPQWAVLHTLHRAEAAEEGALCLRDVSDRLLIRPPSVTGVVDRLERMRLVARSQAADDLRVRRVQLTPDGRALVERVLTGHAGQIRALMAGLHRDEQETLRRLLGALGAHLETMAGPEGAGRPFRDPE